MASDLLLPARWHSLNRAARLILDRDPSIPVLVWGHDDPDGITSTAILLKSLRRLFTRVEYYIPPRQTLHHGLDPTIIDRYVDSGFGILITVDCGISNLREVYRARHRGLMVIITDHHQPPPELPPAQAIVNPKIEEEGRPCPDLAGCGVALYLAAALSGEQGESKVFEDPQLLSWAALGTVADRVPLRKENRIIASRGIEILAIEDWVGWTCRCAGFDPDAGLCPNILKETAIPLLAASASQGGEHEGIKLLQGQIPSERIFELWQRATAFRREIEDLVQSYLLRSEPGQDYHLLLEPELRSDTIGALASRIRDATGRPTIVLGRKESYWVGEVRSYPPFDFVDLLHSLADLFIQYGGHRQAAGFTLVPGLKDEFLKRIRSEMEQRKSLISSLGPPAPDHRVPDLSALSTLQEVLKARFPLGPGNPEPRVAIEKLELMPDVMSWKGKWMELQRLLAFRIPGNGGPASALLDITHRGKILIKIQTS